MNPRIPSPVAWILLLVLLANIAMWGFQTLSPAPEQAAGSEQRIVALLSDHSGTDQHDDERDAATTGERWTAAGDGESWLHSAPALASRVVHRALPHRPFSSAFPETAFESPFRPPRLPA